MLPLNLNLQLNATSALWANDSTMENITQAYSKIWLIKYKKEGKGKGRNWIFFLQEGACAKDLLLKEKGVGAQGL
jgi:hypothetical protein